MLQKEERFLNCPGVPKMKFCQKWWQRFQKDRGMKWKKYALIVTHSQIMKSRLNVYLNIFIWFLRHHNYFIKLKNLHFNLFISTFRIKHYQEMS